jgi:hypothetical protein
MNKVVGIALLIIALSIAYWLIGRPLQLQYCLSRVNSQNWCSTGVDGKCIKNSNGSDWLSPKDTQNLKNDCYKQYGN